MDWGKGIVIVIAVFVMFMAGLVTICVKQDDIHLVTQNYYEEEIKYQDQIDKIVNANSLDYEVLTYNTQVKKVIMNLPLGSKGTLHLFRPSDARLDKKIDFQMLNKDENTIDVSSLKSGYWKVKLTWEENGVAYYEEKKITI
ncbi:FixH family protein [Belliella kenyensis]|uniref:FixH family protein n=1 Tax=Belliella kenyensis TaxID=1472724 RepID=A0ABV8ELR9_9BACT|nr:FixH family protein [Belliella kenyensis]MCH7400672.1 FixH family protein [Belliella kenyensis]MDN3602041.1 FixH family protein [Belliella kenyensis]